MAVTINGTTGITSPGLSVDSPTLVVDDANNRVGIGVENPTEKLQVNVSDGNYSFYGITPNTNAVIGLIPDGTNGNAIRWGGVGSKANNLRFLGPSSVERVRIDGSGNVGIGTTNPSFGKLDIAGAMENQIRINNTNETGHGTVNAKIVAGGSYYQVMDFHASSFTFKTYNGSNISDRIKIISNGDLHSSWSDGRFIGSFYDANYYMGFTFGANNRELYIDNKSNDTRADIVFRTLEGAGTPTERLRITSTGNIGLGNTNPSTRLDIRGDYSSGTIVTAVKISGNGWSLNGGPALEFGHDPANYPTWVTGRIASTYSGSAWGGGLKFFYNNGTTDATLTEGMELTRDGNLAFPSGKGIDFSATANSSGTMTSELLSDYEEGTWTPTIFSGGTGSSYNTQNGGYVRVGNLVYASLDITPTGWTANGNHLRFGGLPFASASVGNLTFGGAFVNYGNMIDQNTISNCQFHISWNGNTTVDVYNNTSSVVGNASGVSINGRLILSIIYRTS